MNKNNSFHYGPVDSCSSDPKPLVAATDRRARSHQVGLCVRAGMSVVYFGLHGTGRRNVGMDRTIGTEYTHGVDGSIEGSQLVKAWVGAYEFGPFWGLDLEGWINSCSVVM
ncbi:hypothetical protein E2C01_100125 [Portunus trituberculatus]|uniref:Uncharacterized protein n=1 Tax=Portunus trituberculatus TaxID=210409 RepID=A0A5B7KH60_PORTR|nr:hypothetical protein [Portunus trituberculatus]